LARSFDFLLAVRVDAAILEFLCTVSPFPCDQCIPARRVESLSNWIARRLSKNTVGPTITIDGARAVRGNAERPRMMMQGRRSSFFYPAPHQRHKEWHSERDCGDCESQRMHGHLPRRLAGNPGTSLMGAGCRQTTSAAVMAITERSICERANAGRADTESPGERYAPGSFFALAPRRVRLASSPAICSRRATIPRRRRASWPR
jgi:hypothetical protein